MKSQELLALLERDRQNENVSLRQQIAYRFQAETVIDQDALIKIETVSWEGAGEGERGGRGYVGVERGRQGNERTC